jgi:hypothetical protein
MFNHSSVLTSTDHFDRPLTTTKTIIFAVPQVSDVRFTVLLIGSEISPSLGSSRVEIAVVRVTSLLLPAYGLTICRETPLFIQPPAIVR